MNRGTTFVSVPVSLVMMAVCRLVMDFLREVGGFVEGVWDIGSVIG